MDEGGGILDRRCCESPTLLRRPGVSELRSLDDVSDMRGAIDMRCFLLRVEGLEEPSRPAARDTLRFVDIPARVFLREFTISYYYWIICMPILEFLRGVPGGGWFE